MPHSKQKRRKLKSLYIWHRYAGVTAALFVIILSVTGVALNHTDRLSLAEKYVTSDWLLGWYGIKTPEKITLFKSQKHTLVHMDGKLYLDDKPLADDYNKLLGLISFPHFLAVAIEGEIILLTHEGEVIDRLSGMQGVPGGLNKMGVNADNVIIKSAHGFYLTDRDFLTWKETDTVKDVVWSQPGRLSEQQTEHYARLYRGNGLPLERVILDLHSGRLFGQWGPVMMDIAAIILVFLALTGIWLWLKQALRLRQKRLKHHLSTSISGQHHEQNQH